MDSKKLPKHLVTSEQASAFLDVSPARFRNMMLPAQEKVGRRNFYDPRELRKVAIANAQHRRDESTPEPSGRKQMAELEYEQAEARAALLREQAEQTRLKNEITRHEMAPMVWYQFVLARMAARVAAALDRIPMEIMRSRGLGPESAEVAKGVLATVMRDVSDIGDREFLDKALDDYLSENA